MNGTSFRFLEGHGGDLDESSGRMNNVYTTDLCYRVHQKKNILSNSY